MLHSPGDRKQIPCQPLPFEHGTVSDVWVIDPIGHASGESAKSRQESHAEIKIRFRPSPVPSGPSVVQALGHRNDKQPQVSHGAVPSCDHREPRDDEDRGWAAGAGFLEPRNPNTIKRHD